jgi:Sensors of blue-light using FAD
MGVTSALCFLNGVYMQYREGDATTLDRLYARIEQDPRHTVPKVLDRHTIQKRFFPHWSMALLTWDEESRVIFRSLSPGKALDLYDIDPSTANVTMRALSATSNWAEL